jgi:hypothetical protein
MKPLADIETALNYLANCALKDGKSTEYLEVLDKGTEIIVGGNSEGLVRLAAR